MRLNAKNKQIRDKRERYYSWGQSQEDVIVASFQAGLIHGEGRDERELPFERQQRGSISGGEGGTCITQGVHNRAGGTPALSRSNLGGFIHYIITRRPNMGCQS